MRTSRSGFRVWATTSRYPKPQSALGLQLQLQRAGMLIAVVGITIAATASASPSSLRIVTHEATSTPEAVRGLLGPRRLG